jgi:hypothetical protein
MELLHFRLRACVEVERAVLRATPAVLPAEGDGRGRARPGMIFRPGRQTRPHSCSLRTQWWEDSPSAGGTAGMAGLAAHSTTDPRSLTVGNSRGLPPATPYNRTLETKD